jgi:hypothetical protein
MQSAIGRQLNMDKLVANVLSTPLTISLSELLGASPQCSKQVLDYLRITRPKTYATDVAKVFNVKKLNNGLPSSDDRLIQLKVTFDNGTIAEAVVDPGSQLDVISKDLWYALQLPIDLISQVCMEDAGSGRTEMYGLCHDVNLTTGNLQTNTNLWVGPPGIPILLGRPWQRKNRISIEERPSGTWLVHRDETGKKTWEICALPAKSIADFTATNHFFGQRTTQNNVQPAYQLQKAPPPTPIGGTKDNPIDVDCEWLGYETEQGDWIDDDED